MNWLVLLWTIVYIHPMTSAKSLLYDQMCCFCILKISVLGHMIGIIITFSRVLSKSVYTL